MQKFYTEDGRYLFVEQGDKNAVVYDIVSGVMVPVFDRWSYEATFKSGSNIPPLLISIPSEPVLIKSGVNPIGMSYWCNINNHMGRDVLNVVLSLNDELIIYTIRKDTMQIISATPLGIHHTGEGAYFSAQHSSMLYIPIGNTLWRYNIDNGSREAVWIVGHNNLWQCHSSEDDRVHSATIQDAEYNYIYWGVYSNEFGEKLYEFNGHPDECQIDKSGRFLICKENNDNRIIILETGGEMVITDAEGAVGHSDVGYNYVVGEDNFIGGAVKWSLVSLLKSIVFGPGIWNMGYVSVQNDKYLISLPDGRLILIDNGNEKIVCNAPTENQNYSNRVKANLCPLAEFAIWTARVNGEMNAYLVRV